MKTKFAICINNQNYPTSLERWKVYKVLEDEKAEKRNLIRIIDESGEDYLYSAQDFTAIELPKEVESQMLTLA
jgi:hypothetical protein